MSLRNRPSQWTLALWATALMFTPVLAFGQEVANSAETAAEEIADENKGQGSLDEATSLKLDAESPADLEKVIKLCEKAIDEGLDEGNLMIANQVLAGTAMQRAELLVQQLGSVAANRGAVNNLLRAARRDLNKAVKSNPKMHEAYVLLAKLEVLPGGSRDQALEYLNTAIELLASQPVEQAKVYLMRAGVQESDEDKLADLDKAIASDKNNLDAWRAKMAFQMEIGKLDEAIEDAMKLLEKDPDDMVAFEVAVSSMLSSDKVDRAIELLGQRIEKDAENGALFRSRAQAYMRQENAEMALADINKALELDARDASALLMRAQVYLSQDEIEKANRDISDSLLIQPNSVQGVLLRSLTAAQEERYSDAIADMELLVRANPSNSAWIMQLASYYQLDERPRLAIRLLDELVKNAPEDWRALRLRGDAKLSISEHVSAVKDYDNAIAILEKTRAVDEEDQSSDIDYSGLLNNLSWVLATSPKDDIRDGKKALDLALKACEATDYEAAHILSTLAAAYAETGDFENARKWAKQAVDVAKQEDNSQADQLQEELDSYQEEKPWREEQNTEENNKPVTSATETIDT